MRYPNQYNLLPTDVEFSPYEGCWRMIVWFVVAATISVCLAILIVGILGGR